MEDMKSKTELENLYLHQQLPYQELLTKLGISRSGFYCLRTKYNIPSRKKLFWKLPFAQHQLENLYVNQKLSIYSIEKKTGISYKTIEYWIKKYNLSRLPIKRSGYHHTQETKEKISIANKGKQSWCKGLHFSDAYCRKISEAKLKFCMDEQTLKEFYWDAGLTLAQIGEIYAVNAQTVLNRMKKLGILRCSHRDAMIGKHHTSMTKQKIGNAHRGREGKRWDVARIEKRRKMLKVQWANSTFREQQLKMLREAQKIKPTKLELFFQKFCEDHNLPFIYVGDGKFFIHGFNPDFIHSEKKQIAIEIFGDYWHSPEQRQNIPPIMLEPNRKAIFQKYGWKLIVIWEHELEELKSSPDNILNKIKECDEPMKVLFRPSRN